MHHVLEFAGTPAMSAFRFDRLTRRIAAIGGDLHLERARYWYFSASSAELDEVERSTLAGLLEASAAPERLGNGREFLVLPRLGTVSPWCSKACEIARSCGLGQVRRIERAILYEFASPVPDEAAARVAAVLHDPMTESWRMDRDLARDLFREVSPSSFQPIPLAQLEQANTALGLALSADEIAYLRSMYAARETPPSDVELLMFAQLNSEHCRHKIFNAPFRVDGQVMPLSLFAMIRETHRRAPAGTVLAYRDNAAIIAGGERRAFYPGADGVYRAHAELLHSAIKVETHNHPTGISPFAGAATGAGGEIRDEGATGVGAKPKAGLTGFSVAHLRLEDFSQPWEAQPAAVPPQLASAQDIMLEAPVGAASFNNEFGRPNLAGYFRCFEQNLDGRLHAYHKPIMLAGGVGSITGQAAHKRPVPPGSLLVQLGGPGFLIGLGGGAASSLATGSNDAALDFASVQRANPEMQRRAQEVIDRCWHLGAANPILSIHDVGAGGLSNALPELAHSAGGGAVLELRQVPTEEPGMSPAEIWCNEAQERYVLAIAASDLARFGAICERERCPFAVLGHLSETHDLVLSDRLFRSRPVDLPLPALLGGLPRAERDTRRRQRALKPFSHAGLDLAETARRVLRAPAVADKRFLITIGDRSVGGLTARDQLVGPWQVAVADAALTCADFFGAAGEAFAIGERTPLAVIDAAASARMAVGEAITNLLAAPIVLERVKLSANWMAAAGQPGEDADLYDAVRAVALDLCPRLGLAIPVGKDSLSMLTRWVDAGGVARQSSAPVSLVVSAFCAVDDVRRAVTPQLQLPAAGSDLFLVDLGAGRCRLGGSIAAQVWSDFGDYGPDLDDPNALVSLVGLVEGLRRAGDLLAYHDRSDGGLFATCCEMAFAAHCGISVRLEQLCFDSSAQDIDGNERRGGSVSGRELDRAFAVLFNEELGCVIQTPRARRADVLAQIRAAGLAGQVYLVGAPNASDRIEFTYNGKVILAADRTEWHRCWSETSYRMQARRDDPVAAQEEFDSLLDATDPGLSAHLTFSPAPSPSAINTTRPRVAILREQGVNGQIEMAAAFARAGFDPVDVHMSDLLAGRRKLGEFQGMVACGGFSYGDVLGAGQGWAKSILYNPALRDAFAAFFERSDRFALGVCNGCQALAALRAIIPGSGAWPSFRRNRSEQFEARLVMVEVTESRSLFFAGMAGSRLPVVVSHGEGRADFSAPVEPRQVALRFVDHRGTPAERYPFNPNGSTGGITGLSNADGRVTILMPHPERVFRSVQMSWHPADWGEASPWIEIFHNARRWVEAS